MKTKAVIIPFFHYHGTTKETSLALFNYFLKYLTIWRKEVDSVYIIDSGDFIPETEGLTILKMPRQSHWDNLNQIVRGIKEDLFLILDSDMIVYKERVISKIFEDLEHYNIVSILDNSGNGLDKKHKVLRANELRDTRQRFTPYMFGCQTKIFRTIDFDFTPQPAEGYVDSMSKITDQLLNLGFTLKELPDDRTTIYENLAVVQWLDSPTFKWSSVINPDYGYYHLRNIGGALFGVQSYLRKDQAWQTFDRITPISELYRLLTWGEIITGEYISVIPNEYREKHKETYKWIKN